VTAYQIISAFTLTQTINTGGTAFAYALPSGYSHW